MDCVLGCFNRAEQQKMDAAEPCGALSRSIGYNTVFAGLRGINRGAGAFVELLNLITFPWSVCCSGEREWSECSLKPLFKELAEFVLAVVQMIPLVGNFVAHPIYRVIVWSGLSRTQGEQRQIDRHAHRVEVIQKIKEGQEVSNWMLREAVTPIYGGEAMEAGKIYLNVHQGRFEWVEHGAQAGNREATPRELGLFIYQVEQYKEPLMAEVVPCETIDANAMDPAKRYITLNEEGNPVMYWMVGTKLIARIVEDAAEGGFYDPISKMHICVDAGRVTELREPSNAERFAFGGADRLEGEELWAILEDVPRDDLESIKPGKVYYRLNLDREDARCSFSCRLGTGGRDMTSDQLGSIASHLPQEFAEPIVEASEIVDCRRFSYADWLYESAGDDPQSGVMEAGKLYRVGEKVYWKSSHTENAKIMSRPLNDSEREYFNPYEA